MKFINFVTVILVFFSAAFVTLPGEPKASESKYSRLIEDRGQRQKLVNLAALEEASIIDTEIISIYVNDPQPLIRLRCAEVMARVQSSRALPYLEQLLHDRNEDVVKEALFALGLIGNARSFEAVKSTILKSTGEVRDEGIIALGRIGSKEAIEYITTLLSNFDAHVRAVAAYAIAASGDSSAAARCISLLNDPSAEVVEAAVYTLGRLKVRGSEKRLFEFLDHSEPMVRLRAAEALGRLKCVKAVPALSILLNDGDRMVRIKAAEALWRIGTKNAAKAVKGLLTGDDHYLQTIALRTIAESKDKSFYKEVVPLISSPSPMVRRAALEAAAATDGGKAKSAVLAAIEKGSNLERMTALELLGRIGDKNDLKLILARLINGKDHFEREGAAAALGNWGKPRELNIPMKVEGVNEKLTAFESLSLSAADPDWVVAAISVESLGKLLSNDRTPQGLKPPVIRRLLNIFRKRTSRVDGDLRLAIVEALGKILPTIEKETETRDNAIETLKLACGDPDPRVRDRASSSLKKLHINCNPVPKSLWKRGDRPWETPPLPMGEKTLLIKTSRGNIRIKLFGDEAPGIVYSIIHLVEKGFYNGLTFHRVVPGFVIQGGDPRGDGWGDAGYFLRSQFNRHRYLRGTVGMAHAGKDTPGCQFFITHLPQPHLDGRYTVVGEVIEGMDVVDKIEEQDSFTVEVIE